MAQPASFVSLTSSRRPRTSPGRRAAPLEYSDIRRLTKSVGGQRVQATPNTQPRPTTPAEVAQARVFEELLEAEWNELAHHVATAADGRPDDNSGSSWELGYVHARLSEIRQLLQALRGRFPDAVPDSNR